MCTVLASGRPCETQDPRTKNVLNRPLDLLEAVSKGVFQSVSSSALSRASENCL